MADIKSKLEICVDSLESIKNAITGGANRLELCSSLLEGGLTPNYGLAKLARRVSTIPIFAMIRIRGGSFVYDSDEMDAMLEDVRVLKTIGVDGFVFGALTTTNQIDVESCQRMIKAANPLPVTFHRAFDDVEDPSSALEQICDLGFARVLTSGQQASAELGVGLIAELVVLAKDRIVIMPGAGVNEKNILGIRDKTGAVELHGSAKRLKKHDGKVKVGCYDISVTDAEIVRSMAKALKENL